MIERCGSIAYRPGYSLMIFIQHILFAQYIAQGGIHPGKHTERIQLQFNNPLQRSAANLTRLPEAALHAALEVILHHEVHRADKDTFQIALQAGCLAGEVVVEVLKAGDTSARFLDRYPAEWRHRFGNEMAQSYRIKELLQAFDDNGSNRSAALAFGYQIVDGQGGFAGRAQR